MKSTYKEIKLKNIFYKFLFFVTTITSSIFIVCAILFFVAPMFRKYDIIPANVFVFENKLSVEVQDEINNAISTNIENVYNRLLANIQLSIALFSVALVIFAIVFGLIYFSKIREAENLIKEIQKTPDLFFKQFYREQFNQSVSNLFSQNYITRNSAINNLTFNPEVNMNDYDVLRDVLLNELDYATHIYFYQNISAVTNILIKIDYSKTISILRNILQKQKYDQMKHYNLLTYIVADNSDDSVNYIKDQLLNNNEMGTQLISLLASNGFLNDYMGYILEECHDSTLQMALNMSTSDIWHINTANFFVHISKREDIDIQCLHSIISHNSIDTKDKIALVLHFYSKNTEKFDMPLNTLVSTISADENAKQQFLVIAENAEYKELTQEFFIKNNHLKSYFSNFQNDDIIKQISDDEEAKTSSVIIKEQNLHLSEDGTAIVDKDGTEHKIGPYSFSIFTGGMFPVRSGVMIDGTFIDIDELKNQ